MFADDRTKNNIRHIMEKCLNGQPIPDDWSDSIINPIYKAGPKKVELIATFFGIAITNCCYKLYAKIVNSRLEQFVESHNILPDCQNGFRKQRSTIDNIYILNHCVNKCLAKGKKLYAFYVDYKAAFDSIHRGKLMENCAVWVPRTT